VATPEFEKDDVKVEVNDNLLHVSGEKHGEKRQKKDGWETYSTRYCSFTRTTRLPSDVDKEKIIASHNNGVLRVMFVLRVMLPKKPTTESKPSRAITVG